MTGLINGGVGILPQGDNTSVKVAPGSRAAGRSHGGKDGGLIPPPGDNTPPERVIPSRSGRTGHNTPRNGVGSPDSNDCALSVHASNVFSAIDDGKRPKQVNSSKDQDDQYQSRSSGSARDNHPDQVLEPDQGYWQNTTNDYIDDPVDFGDAVSSPIASATKISWEKSPSNTSFEHKMELGKIPSNCQILHPKRTNVEIWSVIPPSSCGRDSGIQDIQIITAASASLILQAASDMSQYVVVASKSSGGQIDIMPPLSKIKDALSLAGKQIKN